MNIVTLFQSIIRFFSNPEVTTYQPRERKEFVVTNHARERIIERLKCHPSKIEKLVIKAWLSTKEPIPLEFRIRQERKGYKGSTYRKFLGYIWVFDATKHQKVLVTIYRQNVFDFNSTYFISPNK